MTSLWFLKRLTGDDTIPLSYGQTSIGRDRNRNIVTNSVYASRNHCTLNINDDNVVSITDCGTSNGTFINSNNIKNETVKLYNLDKIGIGCTLEYDGDIQIGYVYIINKIIVNEVVEISDDEVELKKEKEDEELNEIVNEEVNEIENNEQEQVQNNENHKENDIILPKKINETKDEEIPKVGEMSVQEDLDSDSEDEYTRLKREIDKENKKEDDINVQKNVLLEKDKKIHKETKVPQILVMDNSESDDNIEKIEKMIKENKKNVEEIIKVPVIEILQKKNEVKEIEEIQKVRKLSVQEDSESDDVFPCSQMPKNNLKTDEAIPIIPVQIDSDSDDDFAYSQRINQEIKSELMDMDQIFEENGSDRGESDSNESDSNKNDSNYINSDDEVILIDSDDDEVSKKGADKWYAILSQSKEHYIKQEPFDYESEKEIELNEDKKLPSPSCVVKLTDIMKKKQNVEKKPRKLKKNVRELLKNICSESSSEEESNKKMKTKKVKELFSDSSSDDENISERIRKRIKSISSSSSDEKVVKKVKISNLSFEQQPMSVDTQHSSSSSSDENIIKKVKISVKKSLKIPIQTKITRNSSSSSDENIITKLKITDAPPITKPKIIQKKIPMIIDPPHLPAKKGMHRGISIETSEKMLKRAKITTRRSTLTFGPDELAAKHDKEKTIELRKTKLRELAEAEAARKQSKQDDEAKVINTPKVKLTVSNRGAFLTEDTIPKPSSRIAIKIPTRNEVAMLPKIPRIKRKSESEIPIETLPVSVPVPVQEELFTIIVPKKSNLKKDSYNRSNVKKHVTFKAHPEVRTYQIDDGNILSGKTIFKDAPTPNSHPNSGNNTNKPKTVKKDPNKHKVQDILTQVTEWPPEWFEEKFTQANESPPVNGINHLLLPMIHEFKSFKDYEKILLPLMKLELWSSIKSDISTDTTWTISNIKSIRSESRGSGMAKRSLYDCTVKANDALRVGSIVMVKFQNFHMSYCFLAYLSDSKNLTDNNNQCRQLTLETSGKNFHDGLCIGKQFMFKNVGYIRAELNSFTAVYDLKFSPLFKLILDPVRNYKQTPLESQTKICRSKAFDKLNETQELILMDVYKKCIDKKTPSISLIEGPAGTGKSILITNLILQLIFGEEVYKDGKGLKILLCAPSNAAVDIITYKLSIIRQIMDKKQRFKMIRFGIDKSMNPNVQNYSLQSFVNQHLTNNNDIGKEERAQMESQKLYLETKLASMQKLQTPESSNNISKVQIDDLVKDLNRINVILSNKPSSNGKNENETRRILLEKAHIVCTTLSSCSSLLQHNINAFDVCIVDEATQCTEPMSLMPLQFGISKLILVGDTQQLPATIMSKEAKENKFESSLFSRIQSCFSEQPLDIVHKLTVQYRMHPEICRFPNKYFYKNSLKTGLKLESFEKFPIKPYTVFSLMDFTQNFSDLNAGCSNINEADFVVCLIQELFKNIPKPEQYTFAVITPYNKQKLEIESKIFSMGSFPITVNTIDSYQGQEKDIVIISTTRTKGVGFMSSSHRLNVAITRARRCLIICGNFISLQNTHIWSSLIKDATDRNLIYTVSKNDIKNGKRIMSCIKK